MLTVIDETTCLLSLNRVKNLLVSGLVDMNLLSTIFGRSEACSVQCSES